MGKPNCPSASIHHFSHPHPLELQVGMNVIVSCSGCKLNASDTFYSCKTCNYTLHISCSKMPQQITHPADPNHTLSLLSVPAYQEGFFNCDACGRIGNGFSYHCKACNKDIHTLCAIKPLSINHQSHHHPLTLTFSPPYQNKGFSCDICKQVGLNHWLYRCNLCEFDAHLGCASTKPKLLPQIQTQTQPINQQTVQRTVIPQYQNGSQFVPSYMPSNMNNPNPNPNQVMFGAAVGPNHRSVQQGNGVFSNLFQRSTYMPSNMNNPNPNQVVFGAARPNQSSVQQGNGLFDKMLQSAATGAASQFGRSVVQDIMGGGANHQGGGGGFGGGATDFGDNWNGGTDFGGSCNGGIDFSGGTYDCGGDFSSSFDVNGGYGNWSGN
ncbi:uncharacterized protein LOC122642257 [Telopea speciosissima]|uniref:uncharacterized protein LOC122642257 n=1 Tax=Telopea speciosissima TaxID=54955 RepID=UPI001CC3CF39|nr:uncharacterized protein LOC122642257 [Telopea speciosissima]